MGYGNGVFDVAVPAQHTDPRGVSAPNPSVPFGSYNPDRDGFRQSAGSLRLGWRPAGDWRVELLGLQSTGLSGLDDGPGANARAELLNEILQPACPIQTCRLRNPFVFPDRPDDRAVILDLDAIDQAGKVYHVEMQTTAEANLRKRMMFVWSAVYRHQLAQGDGFAKLAPVISVWICERAVAVDAELSPRARPWHTRWLVQEELSHATFLDDFDLHIVELDRFRRDGPCAPSTRWQQFLANAETWATVPTGLESPLLEKAMNVLDRINAHHRDVYEARLNEERRRIDQEEALAEALAAKERAEAAKESAEAAKERAEAANAAKDAEIAQLLAQLRARDSES
jgi:predicted transposase/invertase (TIGR01784 family)